VSTAVDESDGAMSRILPVAHLMLVAAHRLTALERQEAAHVESIKSIVLAEAPEPLGLNDKRIPRYTPEVDVRAARPTNFWEAQRAALEALRDNEEATLVGGRPSWLSSTRASNASAMELSIDSPTCRDSYGSTGSSNNYNYNN
jgi:hypothetical protein